MRSFISIALVAVILIGFQSSAKAQETPTPTCVNTLAPCTQYIYMPDEKLSADCCKPLAAALTDTLLCVCNLYGDGSFMAAFNVDVEAALSLPERCGINIDFPSACQGAQTPPASVPSSSPALSPDGTPITDEDSGSPAGAPTTTVTTTPAPSGSYNAGSNVAMSGFAVLGSFLMWATIMFY